MRFCLRSKIEMARYTVIFSILSTTFLIYFNIRRVMNIQGVACRAVTLRCITRDKLFSHREDVDLDTMRETSVVSVLLRARC